MKQNINEEALPRVYLEGKKVWLSDAISGKIRIALENEIDRHGGILVDNIKRNPDIHIYNHKYWKTSHDFRGDDEDTYRIVQREKREVLKRGIRHHNVKFFVHYVLKRGRFQERVKTRVKSLTRNKLVVWLSDAIVDSNRRGLENIIDSAGGITVSRLRDRPNIFVYSSATYNKNIINLPDSKKSDVFLTVQKEIYKAKQLRVRIMTIADFLSYLNIRKK